MTSDRPGDPARDDAPVPDDDVPVRGDAVVRRAPRFRRFVWTGVVLGVVVGAVAWLVGDLRSPGDPAWDRLVFVVAPCVVLGALLGAAVAVLVDSRSARRADRDRPGPEG